MTDLDHAGMEAAINAAGQLAHDAGFKGATYGEIADVAVRAYLSASAPSPSEPGPRPWPIAPDTELPPRRKPKVSEWTCCGVTFSGTDEFISGARSAHRCSAPSPSPPEPEPCERCNGFGSIPRNLSWHKDSGESMPKHENDPCPSCAGSGWIAAASPSPPEPAPDVDAIIDRLRERRTFINPGRPPLVPLDAAVAAVREAAAPYCYRPPRNQR